MRLNPVCSSLLVVSMAIVAFAQESSRPLKPAFLHAEVVLRVLTANAWNSATHHAPLEKNAIIAEIV